MDTQSSPAQDAQKHYTALVYFHGIGEQRRYEEVSRLVDELDRYERDTKQAKDAPEPSFQSEPTRAGFEEAIGRQEVGYIRVSYNEKGTEYRFYEAYYADLLAAGIRPIEVFLWLLKLSLRPIKIMFTPWRELSRLRRAILLGDWDRRRKKESVEGRERLDAEVQQLLDANDEFENSHQPYRWSTSNFWQYLKHIKERKWDDADPTRVQWNAWFWLIRFIWVQFSIIVLVLTALLTLGLIAIGLIRFLLQLPTHVLPLEWNVLIGAIILGVGWGLSAFLRTYVGDLYFWSSYEETSEKHRKRADVLQRSCAYLSHVLSDPNCDRVVLVGHSMGTTVAHDTLLRLNLPQPELDKIQYFVTLASVVDKVYYLFETVTSKSYQYKRIIEARRGDLGTPPFSADKNAPIPRIHWINFWDLADVASSALYTPTNHVFNPYHVVDNYEVAGVCFPDPSSAHLAYFKNSLVLKAISEVFFDNQHSFAAVLNSATLSSAEMAIKIPTLFIGQNAKRHWFTKVCQGAFILIPWLILLYWIVSRFNAAIANVSFFPALGVYTLVVIGFGLFDWVLRYRQNRVAKSKPQTGPELMSTA